MYYNDYEDYMRNVLGYNNTNDNTYVCNCNYNDMYANSYLSRNNSTSNSNLEQMYPEVYKIINPMVCRVCDSNMQPVSEYLIEQMTDNIYDNVVNRVEIQNVINLNIGTRNSNSEESDSSSSKNRSSSGVTNTGTNKAGVNEKLKEIEARTETRSPQPIRRNGLLRDLIRILIINRLIRPGRPPFRPGQIGPRPGMPGPGYRPTMPRADENFMNNGYIPYM